MTQNIPQPILETDRLILSPLSEKDLPDILEYASHPEVAKQVTWEPHKTIEDSRKLLEFAQKNLNTEVGKIFFVWGIHSKSENGKMIGTIDFKQPAFHSGQFDYALSYQYWNKGLMSEAALKVKTWAFENVPGLIRFQSFAIAENMGSRKVMEKVGLQLECVRRKVLPIKGKIHDLAYYVEFADEAGTDLK